MKTVRPINIAITAMGGQGGGVLTNWITALGEAAGYVAQATSVPGVAQRTGATIYYLELFPKSAVKPGKKQPILALTPIPGDVDIVIASEIMEAGRAMVRGFVSGKTTLIASDHRVYAISEKEVLGDGRKTAEGVREMAVQAAANFISFDMDAVASETGSIISAVLFGALAGSGVLPFSKTAFEQIIRENGKAVEANLRGFAAGHAKGRAHRVSKPTISAPTTPASTTATASPSALVQPLLQTLQADFAAPTHEMIFQGLKRVVDFQDVAYGRQYLESLSAVHALDGAQNGARRHWRLTRDVARYLALKMTFEDTIRVADLKTRSSRFSRFREDVGAREGQIVTIAEFMHPRLEEFCETLPANIGRGVLSSPRARALFGVFFKKGRRVQTTSLRGFLLLRLLAALKPMRRSSLRFQNERQQCDDWLAAITAAAPNNYALACEIAGLQRLIKGYGDTHARGLGNYQTIVAALKQFEHEAKAATMLKTLKEASLADEEGHELQKQLQKILAMKNT